jgi:hypothetical protein
MADPLTRDTRRVRTARPAEPEPGRRLALVIGVNRYPRPLSTLSHAVSDAATVAQRLADDFGFQVTTLLNEQAAAGEVRGVLDAWQRTTQPADNVLIFFAGHGANLDPTAGDSAPIGCLLPGDATSEPATWLREAEIIERVKRLPPRRVFLIFDACYAGTTFENVPGGGPPGQAVMALVAGTSGQPVLDGGGGQPVLGGAAEHSIFTRALLDGLDGFADSGQRPDDMITADELIAYVKAETPWRSRARGCERGEEQTPVGGPLQGSGRGGDFEFRPVRPRLPAPLLRDIYSPNVENRIAAAAKLGVRAPADSLEVLDKKQSELARLLANEREALAVRVRAAESLAALGHPAGGAELIATLRAVTTAGALRPAAATALGRLAQTVQDAGPAAAAACRREAIAALIAALCDADPAVMEAARLALAGLPDAADPLLHALDAAEGRGRGPTLDALACLADAHPHDDRAWPRLAAADEARRRYHLARRRLARQGQAMRRQAIAVGLSGALGLALAYLSLIAGIRPLNPYGPAVLSYNLLPGALAGISLGFMPRLAAAVTRYQGRLATAAGGILGGVLLGLGLALPNWFLGIGRSFLVWATPGIAAGACLGLALAFVPAAGLPAGRDAPWSAAWLAEVLQRRLMPMLLVAAVGALSFALPRIPDALAWGALQARWAEVVRWGFGGLIFGGGLAAAWVLSDAASAAEGRETS